MLARSRWLLASICATCLALAQPSADVAPALLTASDIGARLRVSATPGDYKLENPLVTAAVRKSDGSLTEFWRNELRLPTSPQLGTLTNIDGLWQLQPILYVFKGELALPFVANRVTLASDHIETEGYARLGPSVYRALTTFRLAAASRVLRITTRFELEGAERPDALGFGDAVKWGNTVYMVGGLPTPKASYKGPATWVGRRGAGGDLLLRAANARRFWVEYKERNPGFPGAVHALYARTALTRGRPLVVERELGYESLPASLAPVSGTTGTVALTVVDEREQPLPAKVRVERLTTSSMTPPLFPPDGGLDGTDRFMWTGNGKLERALAPGRYQLFVTSGMERDASSLVVDVRAGATTALEARLPRVIVTAGVVGADLHLHQAPSVDADVGLPERVIAIAAEGVEMAVATDHYVVTDLAPTVSWLHDNGLLAAPLLTVSGTEVSTVGHRFGHFNAFPLRTDQNVHYESTTIDELFADARRQLGPSGVFQVNHPRMEAHLGYFTYVGLDERTGLATRPGFNPRFDTLEVYNGDEAQDLEAVRRVFRDWLHLLGLGQRYVATGSSDSHRLAFLDPGLPRTLIRYGGAENDAADQTADVGSVLAALKAGHATVTSGPVLDVDVAGKGPGETALAVGSRARVNVRVRAAPWIDVSSLEVYVGGSGEPWLERRVRPTRAVLRLQTSFELPIKGPTFVVVAAQGEQPLPNASRVTRPFAFTNPIWIRP